MNLIEKLKAEHKDEIQEGLIPGVVITDEAADEEIVRGWCPSGFYEVSEKCKDQDGNYIHCLSGKEFTDRCYACWNRKEECIGCPVDGLCKGENDD